AARRPLLARAHLPLLALRDAADPEPAEPSAALHAALVPSRERALQPLRRARRAMARLRACDALSRGGGGTARLPALPDRERQPLVPQLADDRPRHRVLRRRVPAAPPARRARPARGRGGARCRSLARAA